MQYFSISVQYPLSDDEEGAILAKASVERQSKMPSFKSGLRRSQRYEDDFRKCAAEVWNDEGSFEERTEYRRRGSSLPTHSSWVNVKILPSLRHSTTDPDICMKKTIPTDVIETDYLRQSPSSSSSNQIPDGTTEETTNNNQGTGGPTCQNEANDAELISETCRDLRKALLDGLDERIIPDWQQANGAYTLLLNADLLDRVSLDIVRMSQHEPSGLNGCRLRTRVERLRDAAILDLGSVRVSSEAEETFEIVLSLKECPKTAGGKPRLSKNILSLLSTVFSFRRSRFQPVPVYVSEAYQLEKVRLHNRTDGRPNLVQCQTRS